MFYFDKVIGKTVLKSDMLPDLNHFFTTRELILKTKDENEKQTALLNRELIKEQFNLKYLATPSQSHTANVRIFEPDIDYPDTDALILDMENAGIFLNFADCTPIILFDSDKKVAAVVHAGWRGTKDKIVQAAFFAMNEKYKSNSLDIIALIGPCICFDCFETSSAVACKLKESLKNPDGCFKQIDDKVYADLKEINKRQLLECGIKQIDVAPYCTCCNNDKFFSYRKENKTTMRMSAFVCL